MFKALITGIIIVLCSTGLALAAPIDLTVPCPSSGNVVVTGDYNLLTGAFTFTFTVTNCQKGTTTYNGSVDSRGTFVFNSASAGQADVLATSTISVVNGQNTGTQNCTASFKGGYDLATGTLTGTATHNCTTTGKASIDVIEFFSGLDIF